MLESDKPRSQAYYIWKAHYKELLKYFGSMQSFIIWFSRHKKELPNEFTLNDIISFRRRLLNDKFGKTRI